MLPKIAAAKEKWVKYLEEHDVDQYLKVETVTDYYKESGYYYDTFRPSFYFKVTEPKGSLSDAEVVFVPLNSYGNHHYSASATTVRLSSLKDMNESSPRHYTQVDDKSFWDDYTMDVTIKSVTLSGGKTLKATDKDNIPDEVKDYLENENESTELAFIKGQIDSGYMSRYDYCDQMLQEELRKKNPLCYDFLKKFD